MATASAKTETVVTGVTLNLSLEEAETLSGLLFTCVAGDTFNEDNEYAPRGILTVAPGNPLSELQRVLGKKHGLRRWGCTVLLSAAKAFETIS